MRSAKIVLPENFKGIDISGKLEYCGLDVDSNIHIIVSKRRKQMNSELCKIIKQWEQQDIFLVIAPAKYSEE